MAEEECPLCLEELDLTDQTFNACQCGYQVCLWCWHQIKNEYNGLCPACRTPYVDIENNPQNAEELVAKAKAKKQKDKEKKNALALATAAALTSTQHHVSSSSSSSSHVIQHHAISSSSHLPLQDVHLTLAMRKSLANVRVVQNNLVYVIGLPIQYASEEKLKKRDCFGQYGEMIKVVVNKSQLNSDRNNATASAYVTFTRADSAADCINALDGFHLDNRLIRASFGTTKYCNFFLRNLSCGNPDCLYLHSLGQEVDSYTKEEMQTASFRESMPPVYTGPHRSGGGFPSPPREGDVNHLMAADGKESAGSPRENSSEQKLRQAQSAAAVNRLRHETSPTSSTSSHASATLNIRSHLAARDNTPSFLDHSMSQMETPSRSILPGLATPFGNGSLGNAVTTLDTTSLDTSPLKHTDSPTTSSIWNNTASAWPTMEESTSLLNPPVFETSTAPQHTSTPEPSHSAVDDMLASLLGITCTGTLARQASSSSATSPFGTSRFSFAQSENSEAQEGVAYLQSMLPNVNISYGNEGGSEAPLRWDDTTSSSASLPYRTAAASSEGTSLDPAIVTQGNVCFSVQGMNVHHNGIGGTFS